MTICSEAFDHQDRPIGFDVGGIVGVSAIGADSSDLAALTRQIGTSNPPLVGRAPDLEIRYVSELERSPRRLIGAADAGSSDEEFYLWSDRGSPVAITLGPKPPFRVWTPRGAGRIPLLVQLISAAAVRRELIPLHASAFQWKGLGVMVAGWSKAGKTEALLSFMERGATYLGDEWLFLSPSPPLVSGIPEPIRIRSHLFRELPGLRARLTARERSRLAAVSASGMAMERVARLADSTVMGKLSELAEGRRHVRLDPARLFGPGIRVGPSPIHVTFLLTSWESDAVNVERANASMCARRMAASTSFEHLRLLEAELKHEFAHPGTGTPLWDALRPTGDVLAGALSRIPAYEVSHPHPASAGNLYAAMSPVLESLR